MTRMLKILGTCGMVAMLSASLGFAQAPQIQWWYDLDAPSFGSAASGDIDHDGKLEIVFGTYFNDEQIHALNAEDGSLLWKHNTGGCNDASPVIADVDLDGELEVILPASSPCMVFCYNGATGAIEWQTSTSYNCLDSPPAVADVDGDGKPEIVFGAWNGRVYCLNGEDGSVHWNINLGSSSAIQSCPNVLDLDGDGKLDVVVAQWGGHNRVYALKGHDGSLLWYSDEPNDYMYHGGSFADVDEDGKPEIAIGCYDDYVYLLNGEDGSLEWKFKAPYYIGAPTSIADLDNDGHLEIVFTSYNRLGVLSHTGAVEWNKSFGGGMFRGAAIADIDADGILDVAVGCDDGKLRVRRGTDGQEIWTYDLQNHYGKKFEMDHAPVVADFDNDGKLDIFMVGGYGTSSNPKANHGRAYMLSAGNGAGPGWPMFRHDERNSGCFDGYVMALAADAGTLSAASGGVIQFQLTAGANNAGRDYILLGSVTGTEPGIPLPGGHATLPLNWDAFTSFVIDWLNTIYFVNFLGTLDGAGKSTATFDTNGPMPPITVGTVFHFAYALNKPWDMASNPVGVEVLP